MKKFTKKTTKPTGKFSSFQDPIHTIFYNNHEVGFIIHKTRKIYLQVIKTDRITDDNPNCIWKNICLKYNPSSLNDAIDYLNNNRDAIFDNFVLHFNNDSAD